MADDRLIGFPDDTFEPDVVRLDHAKLKVCRELKPGDAFEYVFDLGDNWRHKCTVAKEKVAPLDVYGVVRDRPVAIWGWGSIPDQYGRRGFEDDGDE